MCLNDVFDWLSKDTDNSATLIGYFLVFAGLIFTAWQWRRDQNWKRKQFLIDRINAFNDTPGAHNALLMLEWSDRDVPLKATEKIEERYVRVKRSEVAVALIPTEILALTYSPREMAIRDSFEDYIIKLSHLEPFMKSCLLKKKEAQVIMSGLLFNIKKLKEGNEIDRAFLRHLYVYIHYKDFYGIKPLLKRFEININEEVKNGELILRKEVSDGLWIRNFDKSI